VRVVRVCATIKKAEEEVIRRAQGIVKRARMCEDLPMLGSVERAVERERREDEVLARADPGSEDNMSD